MQKPDRKVERRKVNFAQRIKSEIWQENPAAENPYVAQSQSCYGYDVIDLMKKRSFVDTLYLLLQGNLPSKEQSELLEHLMIGFINPGPRHPATRAAMTAGVGRTDVAHILPIGLNVLSGKCLGTVEIELSMKFLEHHLQENPEQLALQLSADAIQPSEGDWQPCPGFGSQFGAINPTATEIAAHLQKLAGAGKYLAWATELAKALNNHNAGWLATGVVAATLKDLDFAPRTGATLYQLISAPGLLAHGLELAKKSITAMPFPSDENYIIEKG